MPVAMRWPTGDLWMRSIGMRTIKAVRRTLFRLSSFSIFLLFIHFIPVNDAVKRDTIWQFTVRTDFWAICMRVWLPTIDFQIAISRFSCEWERKTGTLWVCMWERARISKQIKYYGLDYYYYMRRGTFVENICWSSRYILFIVWNPFSDIFFIQITI